MTPDPQPDEPPLPEPVPVTERGPALLANALLNKGRAFPEDERDALGLRGLVPPGVLTLQEQMELELERLARKPDALERYVGLVSLQDRNETLFHRLLIEYPDQLLPIVYTPTVGQACREFSQVMRRPRGLWVTPDDVGRMAEVLRNAGRPDVRLIVATDNERILGLGDQGAGGMGIPIGKLALYSAGAGIHPGVTLPVSIDVGTDNAALIADPYYIGYRRRRVRGDAYLAVLDAFVEGVQTAFPRAILQWEDLKQHTAIAVLERYRRRIPSFNDDIQGTAGVGVAGILAALRLLGEPLSAHRAVFVGAGAAGLGIARLLRLALQQEGAPPDLIRRSTVMLDSQGLVFDGRASLDADKRELALGPEEMAGFGFPPAQAYDLETVVRHVRPTILVGTSGTPGTFPEAALREMANHANRPIVFPLSNPTSHSEATPAEILTWTDGRALVATGSPFDPVHQAGRRHVVGQANNVFVFPGVGLGVMASGATEVTDAMFLSAARTLASFVSDDRLLEGALYPPLALLRTVSRAIAVAVAAEVVGSGLAPPPGGGIDAAVDRLVWNPDYVPYRPA
ncbi:MAG: NAD-dependent malic enzyme [Actinomycetota bacterium]